MSKLIFITGGVRSGKSDFAVNIAKQHEGKVVFIATCDPKDKEMAARVNRHKEDRPKEWVTIEEPINLINLVKNLKIDDLAVIDCVTLWVSNILMSGANDEEALTIIGESIKGFKNTKSALIIVSNEVGWGIVPENKLARLFRDVIGIAHRQIANVSDEVYLMVSGIPLRVK